MWVLVGVLLILAGIVFVLFAPPSKTTAAAAPVAPTVLKPKPEPIAADEAKKKQT